MKAIWAGIFCAVAIAFVAGLVLDATDSTTRQEFSSSSTRL